MATYRSVAEAKRVSEFEKIRKYVAMPWKGGYGRHSGHTYGANTAKLLPKLTAR